MIVKKTESFQKIIISIAVVLVLFVVSGYIFYVTFKSSSSDSKQVGITVKQVNDTVGLPGSVIDLDIFEDSKFKILQSNYPEKISTSSIIKGNNKLFTQ